MVWWKGRGREGEALVVYFERVFEREGREIWGLALALGEYSGLGWNDRWVIKVWYIVLHELTHMDCRLIYFKRPEWIVDHSTDILNISTLTASIRHHNIVRDIDDRSQAYVATVSLYIHLPHAPFCLII